MAALQNGTVYNIYPDHLGSPRLITNAANTAIWKWASDPFGVSPTNDDPDGDGVKFSYNLRFPGQYFDAETGRHYNYFRDYDPATGRYVESDPIGLRGGMNTYAYVGSNPTARIDPTGELWFLAILAGGGTTTAGGTAAAGGISWGTVLLGGTATAVIMSTPGDTAKTCDNVDEECDPPEGEKFNKVTHYSSHSQDPEKGSHGCMAKTGSPVHWHYDVNHKAPNGKCYTQKHVFGGCGVAP